MKTLPSKQCKNCTGYFHPKKKSQLFCNDACRNAYYDAHYFHRIAVSKICPNCGEEFTTTKPFLQTYCPNKCRQWARGRRYRGEELAYLDEATQVMLRIIEDYPSPRGRNKPLQTEGELKEKLRQRGYCVELEGRLHVGKAEIPAHDANSMEVGRENQLASLGGYVINLRPKPTTRPSPNALPAEGLCPVCKRNPIESPHHIRPRAEGGTDDLKNIVWLCESCHNKVETVYSETGRTYSPHLAQLIRLEVLEGTITGRERKHKRGYKGGMGTSASSPSPNSIDSSRRVHLFARGARMLPTPTKDSYTGLVYRSKTALGKALARNCGLDPRDHFAYYKLTRLFPGRFADAD